jgi:hypothetical protein
MTGEDMTDRSARLALPFISVGQAQKEVTHNEALAILDLAVQPVVESSDGTVPPALPIVGQAWIVGAAASGAWAGHVGEIAGWTDGGWRFVALPAGSVVWVSDLGLPAVRGVDGWQVGDVRASRLLIGDNQVVGPQRPAISEPAGGSTVDTAARAAIAAILGSLRSHGLIAG